MTINLPDLQQYRNDAKTSGIQLPLFTVDTSAEGLLNELPVPEEGKTGWPWTEQVDPDTYKNRSGWPKLTIVTPSFNQGSFIEQSIRSVLLQNYPNLEYIVMDGGSKDETKAILEKYARWISYWVSERDRGQGHAINKGFSLASGSYNAWINSDDYYLKQTFFKVITAFQNTNAGFVYGYALDYDVAEKQFKKLNRIPPLVDCLIRFPTLAQPSCFWQAEIHQPIWEQLHCALDYELWQRLAKGKSRKRLKEALAVANIHQDAKTANQQMKEKWHQDHLLICDPAAHGPVKNWNRLALISRVRNKLYKWFGN